MKRIRRITFKKSLMRKMRRLVYEENPKLLIDHSVYESCFNKIHK